MAKPFGVWGIDIGQCALKALRLEVVDGRPTATAFDYIEHPKILSQPDADPDALTREALEKFLGRNPVGHDQVAVGVAGQSGLVRFVKLPPVEEKKVPDIVKFEAKQQIPFPLEEVVWDYQKISGGEAVGGFAMENEIGLFAMKRDIVSKYLGHFTAVGAEVHAVQMAPLALCNFATYELLGRGGPDGLADGAPAPEADDTPRGKKRCTVVLDIGTDSSNLIITDGGKVIWQRPIPLGGTHFTRALTKEMKLTFAKAEHLKRNAAKSPDLAQILRALRPVLTEFVGEVQRSLGYFTNTHRDAHVAHLVGVGSAFKLPGLQKYLAEKLALEVKKPARFDRLAGDAVLADPTFADNLLTYPVAYGLAIQGLGLARLRTSLLPNEVRVDRLIRAKKPAVAAAAAALLLGTGVLSVGYGAQLSAVTDAKIKAAMDEGKKAKEAAAARDAERTKKQGEVTETQAQVKAIVVGNDERLNWVRFQEVLTAALPRHPHTGKDGRQYGNLFDPPQVKYWQTNEGNRAIEKYLDRMAAGMPVEKLHDDDLTDHLANVNLETVYCRWVDDVAAFLAAADQYAFGTYRLEIAQDMPDAEREKAEGEGGRLKPKPAQPGGGWVVELRGYTHHKDGTPFLRACLVGNLKKFDQFAAQAGADQKVAAIIPDGKDPVKGTVGNVFLLASVKDDAPVPNQFRLIGRSLIDGLVGARPAAGGGETGGGETGGPPAGMMGPGGPGGMMGPGGAAGGGWAPLWASGAAAGEGGGMSGMMGPGGPGGGMTGPGGGGFSRPPGGLPGGGSPDGGPSLPGGGPTPPGGQPGAGRPKPPKPRFEFVACLVWREPTPTDPTPTAEAAAAP